MAAPDDAQKSSLQRLLSLDKSLETFEQRVEEAARIVGLSLDTHAEDAALSPAPSTASQSARLEFVLRWLVDRLGKDASARQSLAPWSLLRLVVQRMPPSVLARCLSASQLLPTCVQALADMFPSFTPSPSQSTQQSARPSKKRKRESAANSSPHDQPHAIFAHIAASIRLLISRATPSPSVPDAASENRIHAVLRLSRQDLVRFVKHCLFALLCLLELSPLPTALVASSLTLVHDLVNLQPNPSIDPSDLSFCNHCLWPAALLLSSLASTSRSIEPADQNVQGAIQLLDRLLATHVFVPARAAFHSATAPVQKKRTQSVLPGLSERLASLRSEIAALLDTDRPDSSQENQLSLAFASIPLLLDLAVRCSPTATPKQRISEGPWIHLLFTTLSDALSVPASASTPASTNQILNQMLDILLRKNLTLDSDLLVKILDSNCHLSMSNESSDQRPDFTLIAKILEMNSGIFTDVNAASTQSLFRALSTLPPSSAQPGADPRAICHEIAVPLMQAYARTRNLAIFLDQWFTCLETQYSIKEAEWFLWTDPSLQDSLRQVLETSLTPAQIAEQLESRRDVLAEALSPELNPSHAFASTVLLNAIVTAVRTDATIDALLPSLESLVATVEDTFSRAFSVKHLRTTYLLPLYSRLYHLWYPMWATSHTREDAEAKSASLLGGPVVQFALSKVQRAVRKHEKLSSEDGLEADSALVLIASICDTQRGLANHEKDYAQLFCQAALPSKEGDSALCYAAQRPMAFLTAIAGFPSLLSCVPASDRRRLFDILANVLDKEVESGNALNAFLNALFATGDVAVKDDFFATICSKLEESASDFALHVLLQWPLKGFTRQQREKILNVMISSLLERKHISHHKQQTLELISGLLEVPNATAMIALDPSVIWSLADLPSNESELDVFQDICKHLFQHLLDTREQDRSKSYIKDLSKLASKFIEKQKDLKLSSAPGKVRLLSVLFEATEARLDEAALSDLTHRTSSVIDSFVKRLWEILSASTEQDLETDDQGSTRVLNAVKALVDIPSSLISSGGSSTEKYTKRSTKHLRNLLKASKQSESVPLPVLIRCFEQLSSTALDDSPLELAITAEHLLAQDLDARQSRIVTDALTRSIQAIPENEKIALLDHVVPSSELQCTAEKIALVRCIVSSLRSPRKSAVFGTDASFVLVRLLKLLGRCSEYHTYQQLVDCVIVVLRDQPNLVTQFSAEMVIATAITLASPSSSIRSGSQAPSIFEGLCAVTQSLLQFHRSSLGGRFHLLVPLMQRLLACLFIPSSRDAGTANRFKHPPWLDTTYPSLTAKNAQKYSRLLENLCNPPQSNVTGNRGKSAPDLVDETRKARMHVAQHAPHILHYFCTLILHGRLGEGMRDALTPGMWAVIDVAEIGADDSRGVKALSASMGNAERAVLRGIWEDWRRFGGAWKG